ncbi:MAG TPA: VOC family protein [Casimicrobiaceae bacterium]|jgi:predicted 3-demethylubiquinone-9 3-methyltransferase (glyoxalase superfamily)
MATLQRITPFLWFDQQAEEAAKFYVSIFPGSRIVKTTHYPNAGQDIHHMRAGSVMTVLFELDGVEFTAINAGPVFKFNEAVSFVVNCDSQAEVDRYWEKLGAGGDPKAQQCGWLKDRYGLSWQVVPRKILDYFEPADAPAAARAFTAMMTMKKLDLDAVRRAYEGVKAKSTA